ncbi:prolyl oligopeptidase family serine peptidase [Prevotella sp. PINT]|jgi:Acetyl esterase (deacetylase)|uniref:acetylxylan esterase n=1 Tax=Palleniella intestinalis TaxID=2736291 RepID=UPI001555C94E|nr:acetylxylan esterase [Palleniella intestinalis]NPD81541.1 prolyl oligopeptidase family serine peptidase [Palleniella intestinalis]
MRKLILALLLIVGTLNVAAENYPYRADYLWVTVPNHADWLYECGENATIEVQFYKYGIPRDGQVSWKLSNDMLQTDKQGTANLKNGRCNINIGSRKTPGFRDLNLAVNIDGTTYVHHIKVGFSVNKITPYTKEPSDFMSFWDAQKQSLKQTLSYTRERAEEYCTDKILCDLIKLKVDNKHSVYAYLTYPRNMKQGSHPICICPPGAGIKTIKEPLRHKYYAENGFLRLEMEIHGIDPRTPEKTFKEIQSAFQTDGNNYLDNGLDNRDNYYMRHVYLALIRATDFMTSLPEWDGKNVAFQGGSQGGALAMVAAGIDKRVTLCVANHPALSDMAGYAEQGRTGGYPHFKKAKGMLTPEKIKVMAYYDVVNFARQITCPTYMTWGYNDNTCPPTTSYAVYNVLKCEKEALITPVNEHWTSDATEYGHMKWIQKHLK